MLLDLLNQNILYRSVNDDSFLNLISSWVSANDVVNLYSLVDRPAFRYFNPEIIDGLFRQYEIDAGVSPVDFTLIDKDDPFVGHEMTSVGGRLNVWSRKTNLKDGGVFIKRFLNYAYFLSLDSLYVSKFLNRRHDDDFDKFPNTIEFGEAAQGDRICSEFSLVGDNLMVDVKKYFGDGVNMDQFHKVLYETFIEKYPLYEYAPQGRYPVGVVMAVLHRFIKIMGGRGSANEITSIYIRDFFIDCRNAYAKFCVKSWSTDRVIIHSPLSIKLPETRMSKRRHLMQLMWQRTAFSIQNKIPLDSPDLMYPYLMDEKDPVLSIIGRFKCDLTPIAPYKVDPRGVLRKVGKNYFKRLNRKIFMNIMSIIPD